MSIGITNSDNLFRFTHVNIRDKNTGFPHEKNFMPNQRDQGFLSTDAESISNPIESYGRLGSTFNAKGEFKDISKFELFSINIGQLKLIDKTLEVSYDPILNVIPERGRPDNPAHCLVDFNKITELDLPEVTVKIRDHAKDRKVGIDFDSVLKLVEKYRKQWD